MPKTEAQKRASRKYKARVERALTCIVSPETADAFKAYCAAHGTTVNAMLSGFVKRTIAEYEAQEEEGRCE